MGTFKKLLINRLNFSFSECSWERGGSGQIFWRKFRSFHWRSGGCQWRASVRMAGEVQRHRRTLFGGTDAVGGIETRIWEAKGSETEITEKRIVGEIRRRSESKWREAEETGRGNWINELKRNWNFRNIWTFCHGNCYWHRPKNMWSTTEKEKWWEGTTDRRWKADMKRTSNGGGGIDCVVQFACFQFSYINNHLTVWGSYWREGRWGYACCHQFLKNSYCIGESGIIAERNEWGTKMEQTEKGEWCFGSD